MGLVNFRSIIRKWAHNFKYIVNLLGKGTGRTFGIFLNGIMDDFGTSYSSTSLITSVQMGTSLCISPIASHLIKKFGCRKITVVGSLVAAIGLFTSVILATLV